ALSIVLYELYVTTERRRTFDVVSWYRSPRTNSALRSHSGGVAEHRLHMEGRAIDVRLSGFPLRRMHELALQMGRGGVGFYPKSDFVHLDNGEGALLVEASVTQGCEGQPEKCSSM